MKTIFCMIIFAFLFGFTFGQEQEKDSTLTHIETVEGNEFFGKIIEEDDLSIKLMSNTYGEVTIQKKDIKKRETIVANRIKEGKFWFPNPQSSRYFWAPNGYGLKKGEGYYQNIYVFWNHFSAGITDHFSLGVTVIPMFMFDGAPTPFMVAPKVSIPIKKDQFNIGIGALLGTILFEESNKYGLLYGTSTIGTRDNNVSFGISYGFSGNNWSKSPVYNFSGMKRITNRGYFISENYIFPHGDVLMSFGGRNVWKRISMDYIFLVPLSSDSNSTLIFPIIGIVIPFGK